MDKRDYWIIWTVYFDSSKSRGLAGRFPMVWLLGHQQLRSWLRPSAT
ncbi:hypothetical protein [Vulcanisaeta sp. JCM 16161]|nr:hypothetical protein [Vulcanisaeta sp. JCM 16161]